MRIQIVLREKQDEDIIKWYKNTRAGDRSVLIREAIREKYINKKEDDSFKGKSLLKMFDNW